MGDELAVGQSLRGVSHAGHRNPGQRWEVTGVSVTAALLQEERVLRDEVPHRLELASRSRDRTIDAGLRDELVVHYRSLVDVASGRAVGAEALVRWEHPERGMVPPMDFIPIAEQTGQIAAIAEHVLLSACQQAARWNAAGHNLVISVNVAAVQFRDGASPGTVERVLAQTGLAADLLVQHAQHAARRAQPQ